MGYSPQALDRNSKILVTTVALVYFFFVIGIYRIPGSVNEWLTISRIGLRGDGHFGVLSNTYSLPTLARSIGVTTPEAWRSMIQVIALVGVGVLLYMSNKLTRNGLELSLVLGLLFFSPLVRAVFNGQADYDGLALIGLCLAMIAQNPTAAIIAGLITGLTNSHQSAAALVAVLLVSLVMDRSKSLLLTISLAANTSAYFIILFFLRDEAVPKRESLDRLSLFASWPKFVDYVPHYFAGAWIVVGLVFFTVIKRRDFKAAVMLFLAALVMPTLSLIGTSDGSRNFVFVMMPPMIFALTRLLDRKSVV